MSDASELFIVFCTCPDTATAGRIAEELVASRLAACVSQLPQLSSTYVWEGHVEHQSEVLLLIKTTALVYSRLESRLREMHPYELPEILAVPVSKGLPEYLSWVYKSTTPKAVS